MRLANTQLPHAVELSPWLWVAAGALVLLVVLSASCLLRRGRARRSSRSAEQAAGLEQDLHAVMRELSAMITSARSALDARAERLEQLIRAADERIERLESARQAPGDDANGQSTNLLPSPPAPSPADEVDARHVQIYELSDDGLTPRQIADHLARPTGEVELILALRPRPRTPV